MPEPQVLNRINIMAIAKMIRKGLPKSLACEKIGISRVTLHRWLQQADELEDKTPTTQREKLIVLAATEIRKARAALAEELVSKIKKAGDDDWRPLTWLAERTFPKDFAEHKTIDATVANAPMLDALTKAANMVTDQDGDT